MAQVFANGLCLSAVYVILALGFGIIYFTTRNFHLAHGAVFTAGAYFGYLSVVQWQLPILLGVIVVILASAAVGCLIDTIVYRPLVKRKSPPEVILIASLGAYIALANSIALIAGNDTKVLRFRVERTYSLGGAHLTAIQLTELAVATVVSLALLLTLSKSLSGKYWRAVADNQTLGALLGFDVSRIRWTVFAVGSALAGLAGFLRALDVGMNPHIGMEAVITAAVICILGGLGVFMAPVVGGILLGVLQSFVVWYTAAAWESAVTFSVLILSLVLRPQGLFGGKRRLEEL
jgi:branched-chain amino acid transport system permease protein